MNRSLKFMAIALTLAAATVSATARADGAMVAPNQATSMLMFDNYLQFKGTGEYALCEDGKDLDDCESRVRLTPKQLVAKLYPKAEYMGFRLEQDVRGGRPKLFLYVRSKESTKEPGKG